MCGKSKKRALELLDEARIRRISWNIHYLIDHMELVFWMFHLLESAKVSWSSRQQTEQFLWDVQVWKQ